MLILHKPLISGAKCSFDEHPLPLCGPRDVRPTVGRISCSYVLASVRTVSVPRADRGSTHSVNRTMTLQLGTLTAARSCK